jgi:hypothetical protein
MATEAKTSRAVTAQTHGLNGSDTLTVLVARPPTSPSKIGTKANVTSEGRRTPSPHVSLTVCVAATPYRHPTHGTRGRGLP